MSSEPRVQLLIVVIFVLLVTCATASYHPWRAGALNVYDVVSSYVLALVGIFGLIFLSLRIEERELERAGKTKEADAVGEDLATFGMWLAILVGLFLALFALICGWCFSMFIPSSREAQAKKTSAAKTAFIGLVLDQLKSENLEQRVQSLAEELTSYDQRGAESFFKLLQAADTSGRSADTVRMGMRTGGGGGNAAPTKPATSVSA